MIHRGIFLLLIPFCVLLPASSYCQPLFSPATVEIPLRGIQSTTIADFNHDGCNDIAILNEDPNTADILLYLMQPTGWYTINEELEDIEGNSISVGDFNGDNNIDLLVNDPTGYLHILLGYGNGTFEDPISIDVGDLGISTPPRFGAIGHLNDDDFADIVCGDSAKTLILLGHGNGYFYTASCFPIGGFFEGYAVLGDLDEDGSTDIILPKYRLSPDDPSDSMTVLLNDGSGTFSQDSIYNVGIIVEPWTGTYSDIDVSDFDGDGVLDVVCAPSAYTYGPYQPAIKFLKGNGDGTFGDLIESETGDELTAIHPVYFNQDGFLDLVVLPPWYLYGNEIGLMLGSSDGSFETLHWHPILSYLYIEKLDDFLTGDFNDDGYQDILIQRRGIWETGGLDILFGDGDTTFQIAPQYEVGINPNSVVSADFNSDHHQDLATANTVGKTITILLNDGSGNFSGEPIEIDVLGDPFIIKTTDLDSDGSIDLIASDTLNTRLIMLLGDGASGFGTFNYYPLTDNPYDLVIGDFNEDNNPDVAVSLNFDKVLVLFGNGLGSFIGVTQLDFSSRLTAITSADFNGDGHLDLATRELTRFSINFGDGSGEFGQRRDYNTDYPSSVVWDKIETSDFNHDGNQDIIVLSWLVGEIWLGDGEGGMIYHTTVNAQSSLNVGLALKDFNGDANIDIAMGGEVVTLLLGDGAGNFNPGQYNYIATPIMHFSMVCLNSLCSGDFNGDGNSDLAVIHPDSNKLAILFGTEGLTHDIGVLTILSPIGEIPSGSEVSPTAELMNLGAETETFQVYFQIGPVYDDTVEVTLGVGERDAITFSPWMPFETGTYNTNCGVIFPADENPHNNLVTGSVTVIDTSSSEEIFIASIWPNSGGDIGWITMTITGLNFEDTVDVRLIKEGQPDIVGGSYQTENTEVISPTKIRAVFNLDGVARGNWDVLVTNRGGGADTLVNGFTVKTGVLHLWVDISGLTTFSFRGVDIPLTYRISAGNNGNVNLDRVILRADVPNYLKITSIVNTANNDTIAYGDSLETLDIYGIENIMVPIYISTIHPGEIKVFNFNVETVYENYPQGVGKRSAELDGAPKFSLKGTVLSSALCFGKNLYNAYEEHDDFELEDFEEAGSEALDKFVEGTIWTAIKFGIQILFPVTIPFIQAYDIACLVMQGADLLGQLLGMGHAELAILFGEFYDPNDKAGPTGFGEEGYITDNRPYQYTIYFENVDTATLPVPIVEVVDTLDPDLNWSTLEFGESKHKLTSMEFDTAGDYGIVTFTFEDIDLPPNINPPEGQSWFTYTIWPESGLASGAQITNQAAIIFRDSLGANEPILTSVVLNTIDNVPPQSSIKILPSTVDHVAFKVSWSGTDDQSGIYQYNVYVSENGGDYDLWLNTEDTNAIYIGKNGNTYTFYSVAIDNVGFMEARPDAPDAVTTIEAQEDIGVNPNPFVPSRGHTVITFFGGSLPNSKIKIYNKAGRLVRTLYETEGESTLEWDATNDDGKKLASGVYIWVLSGPAGKDKGKFAIIR